MNDADSDILKDKRILIVDDEPDILETLEELLETCIIDSAPNFSAAVKFLDRNVYDAAILDIMGVRGFELLDVAQEKNIPTIMLTAHSLDPESLVKSIKSGAHAYVPKDKITDIAVYLADVLKARKDNAERGGAWMSRLKPFFDKKFGPDWKEKDRAFWEDYDKKFVAKKEELENML